MIPCYNESKTVAKVIRDMRKALPESVIYVYDNNSTDGTDEIARKEHILQRTNVLSIISETALSVVLSTAFSKVISRTL